MLKLALLVFAIAALGGLVLAAHVLRGRFAPWAISLLHAFLGASGIGFLLWVVVNDIGPSSAAVALCLFALAALGGLYLASLHLRRKLPPKAVVFIHAGVAVIAFLTLVVGVVGM